MLNIDKVEILYLAIGATDMRKPIDGLSTIVVQQYKLSIYSKAIFTFCNRNKDKMYNDLDVNKIYPTISKKNKFVIFAMVIYMKLVHLKEMN